MGYMRHHAIVVTSWCQVALKLAHTKAMDLFVCCGAPNSPCGIASVSPILPSTINGYQSFFVAPDGSKEGWLHSEAGNAAREAFKGWLGTQHYEDGSSPLDWVEIQYGDDDGHSCIVAHSDESARPAGRLSDC